MKSTTYALTLSLNIALVLYFSSLAQHPTNLLVMQFKLIRDQNNLQF